MLEPNESLPLLRRDRHQPAVNLPDESSLSTLLKVVNEYFSPVLGSLNSQAVGSALLTFAKGWPGSLKHITVPIMFGGLGISAAGYFVGVAEAYNLKCLPRSRKFFHAGIRFFNTTCFFAQFLIAILVDIYRHNSQQFNVSGKVFAAIMVAPVLVGFFNALIHALDIHAPDDIKSLKKFSKWLVLAVLDLVCNASTSHTLIQNLGGVYGNRLESPEGQLIRYFGALSLPLVITGGSLLHYLSVENVSKCFRGCTEQSWSLVRHAPEKLFEFISAFNYAMLAYLIYRNFEKEFGETGLALQYAFWVMVAVLPLITMVSLRVSRICLPEEAVHNESRAESGLLAISHDVLPDYGTTSAALPSAAVEQHDASFSDASGLNVTYTNALGIQEPQLPEVPPPASAALPKQSAADGQQDMSLSDASGTKVADAKAQDTHEFQLPVALQPASAAIPKGSAANARDFGLHAEIRRSHSFNNIGEGYPAAQLEAATNSYQMLRKSQ